MNNIIEQFAIQGSITEIKECNTGHINSTYFVSTSDFEKKYKYVLQKINTYVFKNPDQLMSNIFGVTEYLAEIIKSEGGDYERGTLHFVKTNDGNNYYRVNNDNCWRMYVFVDNVISYQLAETPDMFQTSGFAFGEFQKRLSNYDASKLYETIPDFHNTKKRFERFCDVIENCNDSERLNKVKDDIAFIKERKNMCSLIVDKLESGDIPIRVTHNDTKLNNILIDKSTNKALCIVDLDTIMPGSSLYDFGDAIRTGASNALEDEKDLTKVYFREEMFEAYAKGYLLGSANSLTPLEINLLPYGAYIMTFEQAIRFLTDYLEGDVYYRVEYSDHNLIRARNQLKLIYDIENKMNKFKSIIYNIIK